MEKYDKVSQAVNQVFGIEHDSVDEIEEGLISETFEVSVKDEDYIVQFSDKKHLETCLIGYEMFDSIIPVPDIVTENVKELEGENFVIVEKIAGGSAETDINPERVKEAGKALAKIQNLTEFPHEGNIKADKELDESVSPEDFSVERFEEESLKRRKLDDMYDDKIPILTENGFEVADNIEEFLKSNESVFPTGFTATISHRDFSPDNIIYQGEEISGIIDFDFMIAGLDVRDLVKAANSFWIHDPDSWDVRETLYEAYEEERKLPENFEELEAFFRIETMARLIASTIDLGEMTEDEKEFYRERLVEEFENAKEILL